MNEEIVIEYHPHDEYTDIAEEIASKYAKYLKQRGIIHGELGFQDELEMLIAQELRRRRNDTTEKTISEKVDSIKH